MMDVSSLLSGIGIFVCVGAILLIAVVAFAARALMRNRSPQQKPTMWNTPGEERPTYNDPDVESRGGFGSVPTTGQRNQGSGPNQAGFNQPGTGTRRSSGFGGNTPSGGAQNYASDRDRDRDRDRNRTDDDDVRSSGGFGGG